MQALDNSGWCNTTSRRRLAARILRMRINPALQGFTANWSGSARVLRAGTSRPEGRRAGRPGNRGPREHMCSHRDAGTAGDTSNTCMQVLAQSITMEGCVVCMEKSRPGLDCPAGSHFVCDSCFDAWVASESQPSDGHICKAAGQVWCPCKPSITSSAGCSSTRPFTSQVLHCLHQTCLLYSY